MKNLNHTIPSWSFLWVALISLGGPVASWGSPLEPLKLDHPRDTMATFMSAMTDYKKGNEHRLDDAVRTLDLSSVPPTLRDSRAREAAVLLKEVIDRVIVIDLSKVPTQSPDPKQPLLRWRLKGTEIAIARVETGSRLGEYLFTADTVERVPSFYRKVRELPYLEGTTKGANYKEPWFESNVPVWAKQEVVLFKNWQWLGLFFAILLGLLVRELTRQGVRIAQRLAKKTQGKWDEEILLAVEKPIGSVAACGFWYFSVHLLNFSGTALAVLAGTAQILLSIGVIRVFYKLVDFLATFLRHFARRTETPLDDHLVRLLRKALKIFVVAFGALIVVQNLGFNVMSIFAGLGLGGLAFALAAKDTAANLFGSIMIFLDKPFRVGDWIVVDGVEGNVEEIGFRSTRVRTFYNSLISVPNSVVANAGIDNMGKREYRRIKATLSLTYDTPVEKLEAFLEGVKNIVKANPHTRKDYFHVVFEKYAESSLDVLLYCFLKVPDWSTELVERQNLYLEILRLAQNLGVDFAFPTQTLHVENFPEKKSLSRAHQLDRAELKNVSQSFGPEGKNSKPAGQGLFVPPYKEPNV